jgi:cytochrome c-type biogenesis protein CcmH/NrfF
MRARTALVAWSTVIVWWGVHAPARAQGPPDTATVQGYDDTEAQRVFGGLMSPYCPGLTLATCPSPGADSLRQDIRQRLSNGESPESVRATYVSVWGEQILGAPPLRGWGIALRVIPYALLVLGAVLLALWVRAHQSAPDAATTRVAAQAETPAPDDSALRKRVEEELAAFENRD